MTSLKRYGSFNFREQNHEIQTLPYVCEMAVTYTNRPLLCKLFSNCWSASGVALVIPRVIPSTKAQINFWISHELKSESNLKLPYLTIPTDRVVCGVHLIHFLQLDSQQK